MDRPKLIFIIGGCGVGKSSVCHQLREVLRYTTLLDLSAVQDKTEEGQRQMYKYHSSLLDMFDDTKFCGMSWLCCRSFICEKVFCNLGCKEYDFERYYEALVKELDYLSKWYDTYVILLTTNAEDLKIRLNRDKFAYNPFSVENSLEQQKEYKKEVRKLVDKTDNVKILEIKNDNIERVVNTIVKIVNEGLVG